MKFHSPIGRATEKVQSRDTQVLRGLEWLLQETKLKICEPSDWEKMTRETGAEVYKIASGTDKTNIKYCIWYFPVHDNQETIGQQFQSKQQNELS